MGSAERGGRPGTLFGELLRQRRLTAEQFSRQAELFARQRGMKVTLGARQVQRLASGVREDGRPLGPPRLVTQRLLEEMFSVPIDRLLAPVKAPTPSVSEDLELQARITRGRNVDRETVRLLQQKLDITRVIDRRLGASVLLGELRAQIDQMDGMLDDVLDRSVQTSLAAVVVDASALAGWQSLDQGDVRDAWAFYNKAVRAGRHAQSPALEAYASAGKAVVLLDLGETQAAVDLTDHARRTARGRVPRLLVSWLTAAYGEACAANGEHTRSMRAFDDALGAIPADDSSEPPYLVFDGTHLSRWRGNALARLGAPEAIDVLSDVLERLDPSFARAETALRIDLAQVFTATGDKDAAAAHAERARLLATQVGSVRQRKRLASLVG
ncbi:hypothetical protein SAMN05216188_10484 [Lentzea xinjiangensis]|uniref:Tetratricopeptide repeat-containing protein n=1 Tax=Lentzea xinjiangensis TaxID=402600 RepID=A0A1H9HKY1_9PSEU|nr:hypothetical protein [Lentzea xinjiangensis]SEQ62882.1 hypothetical protein SAMN05216188_10484 [Lentzea xinjiangensis]